jgi:hypothetical protein
VKFEERLIDFHHPMKKIVDLVMKPLMTYSAMGHMIEMQDFSTLKEIPSMIQIVGVMLTTNFTESLT